jgi:CRP/FNR family transcriptional regulator, cyclic AMP receptor protein
MTTPAASQDNAVLLERCLLFEALDADSRIELAHRAHRRRFAAGDAIVRARDPGRSMMAVASGKVRISLATRDGKDLVLADLGEGELFGEIALLDGRERSADATALTDCEILVLERADVVPILESKPEACLKLLETLCERIRSSDERMADIAFFDAASRVAKAVLRLVEQAPGAKAPLSQAAIAHMTGNSVESVNRQLRDWHRRGVIELREGGVVVLQPKALADLAGG